MASGANSLADKVPRSGDGTRYSKLLELLCSNYEFMYHLNHHILKSIFNYHNNFGYLLNLSSSKYLEIYNKNKNLIRING